MIGKKLLLIFVFILFLNGVFATVSEIIIDKAYVNSAGPISFTVTADSYPATLQISSTKDGDGIDFNVSSQDGVAIVSFTEETASVNSTTEIPTIPAYNDRKDTITITDGSDDTDTVYVDYPNPSNDAILSIVAGDGNYGVFYSGEITINYLANTLTDDETYIDKHIIYLVPVSDLDDYDSDYIEKYVDVNTAATLDINSVLEDIDDGNYYVVIDANDIAGNYSDSDDVMATKQNIYFDNTEPAISSVNVGTINSSDKIYTGEDSFPITVILSDASGIASGELSVILPNDITISDNTYSSGYSITEAQITQTLVGHTIESEDIFQVHINATDNVGNEYDYDFNIVIDLTAPTTPTTTVAIEDVDKNITITRSGTITDAGSGLEKYEVYKGTSSFTVVDEDVQELVCTMTTATSCVDSDDKYLDTTLYYGVVSVDYAGNKSTASVKSIWTGPDCDVEINDGDDYTTTATVNLDITYDSRDVNEMAFSCNNSTFSTFEEIDDFKSFNITSGNGCTATNEEKTVYVKLRSEDEPTRFTTCSEDIILDNTPPTVPTNLVATIQSDGSAKLTWTESTESVDPDTVNYRIYYSTSSTVTTSDSYKTSTTNSYLFSSNIDQNLYFKVSALDLRGNESALSTAVLANVKKIGPRFIISVNPSNDMNGEIYVTSGTKTINFESDESLTGNPQVSIKSSNSSTYTNINSTYDNTTKKGTATHAFSSSGVNTIKITGINTKSEQASSELEVILDNTTPDFNFTYELTDSTTYTIGIFNLSTDVYKVEYVVDDINAVCTKQDTTDYNCIYETTQTPDGNHTMYITVYDKALNKKKKSFTYVVDNIDEDKVECEALRDEISTRLNAILENLDLYKSVDVYELVDENVNEKIAIVNTKRAEGNEKYASEDYIAAKVHYLFAKNELILIEDMLPKITLVKSKIQNTIFDANSLLDSEKILDANILKKTKELYDQNIINVDRNFDVLKIGNQNFFSVVLTINNTSAAAKEITVIETIPKNFANNISKLTFNKKIEVLEKDPVIKHTLTILAKSSENITYRSLSPVTDLDKETKYNAIKFKPPLIIDGNISADKIKLPKQLDMNLLIYFFAIIIVLIIVVIIITAINNFRNKKMEQFKPDPKKLMSDYLGNSKEKPELEKLTPETQKTEAEKTEEKKPDDKSKSDKFNEDYQYILSSIKKR